mmetsp:Transcript_38791/g.93089  ORF Transcript_38791/g.93089 Transcript_38791/m.93089 type:complete len:248 (-) Transcript_38791:1308-2051(-)
MPQERMASPALLGPRLVNQRWNTCSKPCSGYFLAHLWAHSGSAACLSIHPRRSAPWRRLSTESPRTPAPSASNSQQTKLCSLPSTWPSRDPSRSGLFIANADLWPAVSSPTTSWRQMRTPGLLVSSAAPLTDLLLSPLTLKQPFPALPDLGSSKPRLQRRPHADCFHLYALSIRKPGPWSAPLADPVVPFLCRVAFYRAAPSLEPSSSLSLTPPFVSLHASSERRLRSLPVLTTCLYYSVAFGCFPH